MATIIDALIVTLGLDASGFKKGEREAADSQKRFVRESEASAKQIAAQAKVMTEGFRRVRNELLGLFAVAIGANGLKDFIANSVKGQAELGYLSKNLGMSARELDAWGKTVKTVGGSAEGFQTSLQNIASGIEAFKLGEDSPVVAMFRSIGVNVADSSGKMRPFKDMLLDVADALQRYDAQDQIKIAQSLGIDQGTLNVLRQGRQAVQDLYAEMYKSSGVTDESVKRAQEAQRVWGEFTAQADGVGQAIFESMGPALVELTKDLRDLGTWVNQHRPEIQKFFTDMVSDGKELAHYLKDLSEQTDGWSTKLLIAVGALGLLSGSLKNILGIITAPAKVSQWALLALGSTASAAVTGAAAMLYSESLNEGEDEAVQQRKAAEDAAAGEVNGGADMAQRIMRHLIGLGWTKEQAAGITANLSVESGFNSSAVGDNGMAYGIAQWHPDRQKEFEKWAGKDIRQSTLEEQVNFLNYELRSGKFKGAGDLLAKASSAREAAALVTQKYEIPADVSGESAKRATIAAQLMGSAPDSPTSLADAGRMTPEERAIFDRDRAAAQQADMQYGVRPGEMRIGAGAGIAPAPVSTTSNEVSIGQVIVQTQATDAPGIARDMGEALRQNSLINSSATGMN